MLNVTDNFQKVSFIYVISFSFYQSGTQKRLSEKLLKSRIDQIHDESLDELALKHFTMEKRIKQGVCQSL